MKIAFWGTYDPSLPRTRILIQGLKQHGVEVVEQNLQVWKGLGHARRSKLLLAMWLMVRYAIAYPWLISRFIFSAKPDLVVIPYLGHFDVPVFWLLAKVLGVRFCWDIYISLYDTVVEDRGLSSGTSLLGRVLKRFERVALRLPDRLIADTESHARYFVETFDLAPERVFSVPVGAEDWIFKPQEPSAYRQPELTRILFYGSLIPLHGIGVILNAVRATRDDDSLHWTIVGKGQEQRLVKELEGENLPNFEWIRWLEYPDLVERIANSDLCLGIFGNTPKAERVVPNKVYQALAMLRPILTMDSRAIREMMAESGISRGIWLSRPGSAKGLVDSVAAARAARHDPAVTSDLEKAAARYTPIAVASKLLQAVEGTVDEGKCE